MHRLKPMSLDGALLCHPTAPTAPQCVQGVKVASPGGGSQVSSSEPRLSPPARTPERPGSAQLHVCQRQWRGTMGEWREIYEEKSLFII